jgi:hypothetical protein
MDMDEALAEYVIARACIRQELLEAALCVALDAECRMRDQPDFDPRR